MTVAKTREPPLIKLPAIATLDAFREWMHTTAPERGRFWFVDGKFEADMSPEKISVHNFVKAALYRRIGQVVEDDNLGQLLPDGAFLVNETAMLGTEPDMMFCSWDSFREGRVRIQAWRRDAEGDVEVHGTPDVVIEIVSDSSVKKDTIELRRAYFLAGIPEYWLIDARGDEISFQLLVRDADDYRPQPVDANGYSHSIIFGRSVSMTRRADPVGGWVYRCLAKDS